MAILPAVALTVLIGLAQDRLVYKPLRNAGHLGLMIASLGLSYLLRNTLVLVCGPGPRTYNVEINTVVTFLGLTITNIQSVILLASLLLMGSFALFLYYTMPGKNLRAFFDNRELAHVMGVSTQKSAFSLWTTASLFAGCGGILLVMNTSLDPSMGPTILMKAFAAFLLGGAGNIWGALWGGLIIGVTEEFAGACMPSHSIDYIPIGAIIVAIVLRRVILKRLRQK